MVCNVVTVPVTSGVQDLDQPTNLLAVFIEYTSIILHDVRGELILLLMLSVTN